MTTDLQSFSRTLFAAADQLWTNSNLRPDQYAQPVLALIALRQMEAKFETVHAELAPHYKGRLKPAPADYQAKGAIFLPENARFTRLLALPGTADLGAELNTAMKVSPEFTGRADETKRDYKRYLGKIERAWGSFLVSSIRPKHVIALRDEFQETPSTANHLLSILKTLINWGIPREYSEANPCVHVPKLEVEEEGARPWPAWAYHLVEEHGREDYRARSSWAATRASAR